LHHRPEIIEGNLNHLKKELIQQRSSPGKKPNEVRANSVARAPKLYLICEPIKRHELTKAVGYGREKSIADQLVYIAPPDDHQKERYRTHQPTVIRQADQYAPSDNQHAFIDQFKRVGA
jgi:hypothetical protein